MKKYLIVFIALIIIAGGTLVFYSKPILLRTLAGGGRVLYPPLKAEVRINGEYKPSIKCFKTKAYSGDHSDEMIVIYDSEVNDIGYNEAIIVDITKKEAGLPNAGVENYLLLWSYFLFQSESGAGWVPFSSGKFDPNDPKYIFEPAYIRFDVPSRTNAQIFEVLLK